MMIENVWFNTIIGGILTTLIYELGKSFILYIYDKRAERSLEFSIAGYWCSYVTARSERDKKVYTAYELMKLSYKKGHLRMELYHLTNDARKYYYKGIGFLRGDKIVIAYEDSSTEFSNHVGTMILRYTNILEHQVCLAGNYHEFKRNGHRSAQVAYLIKRYQGKRKISKLKKLLFGRKYIYTFMQKDEFINECKEVSKMW